MPDKQLQQTIALLEELEKTTGLNDRQRKQLRLSKLKLRFWWARQVLLHGSFIVLLVLSWMHWKHLDHVNAIYSAADRLDVAIGKTESSQRGFLLTGKQVYLSDYDHYARLVRSRMDALCLLIPANEANERLCHDLEQDIKAKLDEMESTVIAAKVGNYEKALQIVQTDRGLDLSGSITRHLGSIMLGVQPGRVSHHGCLIP